MCVHVCVKAFKYSETKVAVCVCVCVSACVCYKYINRNSAEVYRFAK